MPQPNKGSAGKPHTSQPIQGPAGSKASMDSIKFGGPGGKGTKGSK